MDGTRAIMPLHFTTDKRNAKVNPSLKKLFEKKIQRLIQHKADGGVAHPLLPRQGLSITLTLPYCRIFLKIITLVEKIFLKSRFTRLYIQQAGSRQARNAVGFETAKMKLPARPKGIKRACFLSLTTAESRLERFLSVVRLLQVKWVVHTLALLLVGGTHEAVF